jgi:hypothetical protein
MLYPATYDIVVLQNATYRMQLTVTQSGGTPINLSGYTIDSDICGSIDGEQVATFIPTIVSAASGVFQLTLPPATTSGLEPGSYKYDVSATAGSGDRYYWLKGACTISGTCSRN